ncbi:MAG: selenide, water dikinase SelD [Alphaproteobacteria bacterium]
MTTDIVLVGGGHAHVAVLRRFGMKPEPGVRLTVIGRDVDTPYSGMIPGYIAGHYRRDECHIDLRPLAMFAGARLIHAPATGLDLVANRVLVAGRPPVPFDLLSLDTGSTPPAGAIAGAAEHTIPVKPIDRFLDAVAEMEATIGDADAALRIVVIGAGAGGTEVTLALHDRLTRLAAGRGRDPARLSFTIVDAADTLVPALNPTVRNKMMRVAGERGIALRLGTPVERIEAGVIRLAGGDAVAFDRAVLINGAAPPAWLSDSGLVRDERGFVRIGPTLASPSHGHVFAAGDMASYDGLSLPKSGVYAVRAGPWLADNLRRAATGRDLRRWTPQRDTLALVSTGDKYAVAAHGGMALEGAWTWRWKDWIDRRFMAKYQDLPDMEPAPTGGDDAGTLDAMRCGGCAAKIAQPVLRRALARLPAQAVDGLVQGLDAPDDAAVIVPPSGRSLVQTVDFFRAFIDDPYLFGRIAANHCLGDLFAMGAAPHSALALAMLPHGPAAKTEDDLAALLSGAAETLAQAGAALAGGHTGEGAELAFGLSLNGFADPDAILRKGGLRPSDRLILTKPLGTGVLFAADMRHKAKGADIDAAFVAMLRSTGPAASVLLAHGATACTDVTGFGLAGHLGEMVRASDVDAFVDLDAVPVHAGVLALSAEGIESTLAPDNSDAARPFTATADHPVWPLLFDPQTAGGLVAGVPSDRAQACLDALHRGGDTAAAIVGTVETRAAGVPAIRFTG